ncbi:unnamed protein product [Nezara viridula]|uniref:Uncharacterized protein n=1 Tax=Nezara viridula TaxID=85310 RepID=A0A9P0HQV3_NEZVI|nr:unnamed protein product [Nezara viridula]
MKERVNKPGGYRTLPTEIFTNIDSAPIFRALPYPLLNGNLRALSLPVLWTFLHCLEETTRQHLANGNPPIHLAILNRHVVS